MRFYLILAAVLCIATSVTGQSLSEIAKKEKERRKLNETKEKETRVITEADLAQGRPEAATPGEISTTPSESRPAPAPTSGRQVEVSEGEILDETAEEGSRPLDVDIPPDAPLSEKLRVFGALRRALDAEAKRIDEQIAKNNARLAEIEQRLSSIGAGGLPIIPQADRGTRHEGELFALQSEKTDLQQQNTKLEADKEANAAGLREKGRRAGIPPGYLRF